MSKLSERLKEARTQKGLSQSELARRIGIKPQAIQFIESGKSNSSRYLAQIAKALEVDSIWLATGYGSPGSSQAAEQPVEVEEGELSPEEKQEAYRMRRDYILVPRVDVTASMGHGFEVHSEQVVDHLAFQRSWIEADLHLNPEDLVLIKARGDSMTPTINPGELLLVDTATQEVHDGQIYVMSFDGDLLAKRVQKTPVGGIVITSDNPKYESFSVEHDEAANLKIIGRVVWAGRRM